MKTISVLKGLELPYKGKKRQGNKNALQMLED